MIKKPKINKPVIKNARIRTVIAHVKAFLDKSRDDNVAALSGQSAFFLLLSIIPLIMFACALILILTGRTITSEGFLNKVNVDISNPIINAFRLYIVEAAERATSGTVVITVVMTLWSAGRGMYCITEGISRIYRLPNKHFWLSKRIFAMGYTLVMLVMFALGLFIIIINLLVSISFESWLGGNVFFKNLLAVINPIFFGLIQLFIMTFALKLFLIRKVEDKRYRRFRALLPGMLFTVAGWYVLSWGVSLYIRYFSASSIYGSLGTIAVIMIWIYFMMYILLYGVQLNYIYRDRFSLKKSERQALKAAEAPQEQAGSETE